MNDLTMVDEMPLISSYTADDGVADGTLLDLMPDRSEILPIKAIHSMDAYLKNYGAILGKKAIHALAPLHVPFRDELPDFSDIPEDRQPFPAQAHVIAAAVKMMDKVGSGFIVGEMGTGKTLLGMLAAHKHAQRSRKQGGSNGKYRAIVLCPDHLIGKWCREIEETIPESIITRFGPKGGEAVDKPKRRKKGAEKPDSNMRATLRDVIALLSTGNTSSKAVQGKGGAGTPTECPVSTGRDTFEMREPKASRRAGKTVQRNRRWSKPEGAEFFVLGRNQAKWLSDWTGMANLRAGFRGICGALTEIATTALIGRDEDGKDITQTTFHVPMPKPATLPTYCMSSKTVIIDKVPVLNEFNRPSYNRFGSPLMKNVTGRVHICPSCGQIATDKKGVPLSEKDLQKKGEKSTAKVCRGSYLQMLPAEADKPTHALDRITFDQCNSPHADHSLRALGHFAGRIGHELKHGGYSWKVTECKAPLYNFTSSPYRWSPALVIKGKCRRMFKYLIIDEVHEQKSDESAQSMACGKLIGAVDHVLALTGTIIGGYANHLYPLMMRISPKSLRAEGFSWDKPSAFDEAYGRIDRIVTIKEQDEGGPAMRGNVKSMRRAKSGSRTERKAVRPGVMPTMFGRHMIGSCMFITLDEMSSELPDLFEYVGGPVGPAPKPDDFPNQEDYTAALGRHEQVKDGWFEMACDMEPDQRAEYKRVMATLEFANKELLRKGSMKLLGSYLWTGMDYPDKPFGWGHDPDMLKDLRAAHKKTGDVEDAMEKLKLVHTVGFWDKPGVRTIDNFVGVVTPKDCPEDMIYPKERALIDLCVKQKKDGRQTWVYVNMTNKRNIQPRLAKMLEAVGLKVGILRSGDVEPIDREEWIAANGRDYDVMISHPQLVSTGLDLFSKKQGGHNYSTLVFYETGYNLFTMRQAARRAWRIGQPLDCRVYYLYYKETMQHKAMTLMSKKMAAAQALEGEFSEEGLAAMAGEDNLQMALAKNLSERIDDSDMQRTWGKIKSGPKKVKRPTAAVAELTAHGSKPSPLDSLPIELQIVSESLIEAQGKPVPADALAGFGELAETLRALDAGFDALSANEEFAAHEHECEEEADDEDEDVVPEPVAEEFDTDFDEEYVPEPVDDDDDDMVMSEEVLAKMFANMMAHGLEVG